MPSYKGVPNDVVMKSTLDSPAQWERTAVYMDDALRDRVGAKESVLSVQ